MNRIPGLAPIEVDEDMVICPICVHQFRATPFRVQQELSRLRAALTRGKATDSSQSSPELHDKHEIKGSAAPAPVEVADTLAILRSRDLEIAEFHAMQLPLAALIERLAAEKAEAIALLRRHEGHDDSIRAFLARAPKDA